MKKNILTAIIGFTFSLLSFNLAAAADQTLRVGFIATQSVSNAELSEFQDWVPFFEDTWNAAPPIGVVLNLWRGAPGVNTGNVSIPRVTSI
jgi:hypothetical protein